MKLRTRLNLVLIGLTAVSVTVLAADELRDMRASIREEIEAANRVAAHLLGRLGPLYATGGGPGAVRDLLLQLGCVLALPAPLQAVDRNRGAIALRDEADDHVPALTLGRAQERAQRFVGRPLRIEVERVAREAPGAVLLDERERLAVGQLHVGPQLDLAGA